MPLADWPRSPTRRSAKHLGIEHRSRESKAPLGHTAETGRVVGGVALRGRESARTLLARIAAGLRQPQWRVALVPLVERLSAENTDFHAPGACVALCGEN